MGRRPGSSRAGWGWPSPGGRWRAPSPRSASSGWSRARRSTSSAPAGSRTATPVGTFGARWPPSRCPGVAEWILAAYFVEGGIAPGEAYRPVPRHTVASGEKLLELTVAANFVEVFLAKEGHAGLVGVNYLHKIDLPLPAACFGALLAGVDVVLVGAGNPADIPALVRGLATGRGRPPRHQGHGQQGRRRADRGAVPPPFGGPRGRRAARPARAGDHRLQRPRERPGRRPGHVPRRFRGRGPQRRRSQRPTSRAPRPRRLGPTGLRRARRGRHHLGRRPRTAGVGRGRPGHARRAASRPRLGCGGHPGRNRVRVQRRVRLRR